jgi:polysaccharide pyruvyl transferase CsaB
MPTILLSGYYGFGNIGDEAILAASIGALRAARADLHIEVLSADPQHTAQQYCVRATPRSNPWHILAAIRRADLVLSGGGGLIQDVTSRASPLYYLGILRLAQLLRRKTMVFSQGIGPLQSRRNTALTLSTFRRAHAITVRDEESADWLRQRGFGDSAITVAADAALLLQPCATERAAGILGSHGVATDAPRIGICVRPWPSAPELSDAIASLGDELAQELSAQVILLPFHPQTDVPFCQRTAARMHRRATVLGSGVSPSEVLGIIAHLDLLIGMRLHSLIFAGIAGRPLLGISYDPKVDAFLQSIGLEAAASVEALDVGALAAIAGETLAHSDRQREHVRERVEDLKRAAQRSIQVALSLVD